VDRDGRADTILAHSSSALAQRTEVGRQRTPEDVKCASLTNTLPFNNAYGAIVTAMDTSNVDTVFIAGKAVKRHGKLVGVDLAHVQREAAASRDYLIDKLGWSRSVIDTSRPGH
jgi:hypothetical protein